MTPVGRILILPKGRYDADIVYNMLDLVMHNGTSWLAKKTVVGIEPSEENSEHWQKLVDINESVAVQIEDKINEYFLAPSYVTPIQNGGTGGKTLEEARANLGFPPDYITSVKNGGTGASTVEEVLVNLGLQYKPNFQIVSYTGIGEYGIDHPCSLTFDFAPDMILWVAYESDLGEGGLHKSDSAYSIMLCDKLTTEYVKGVGIADDNWNHNYAKKSADGKTVFWYASYTGASIQEGRTLQLNNEHNTYYFIGIGKGGLKWQ